MANKTLRVDTKIAEFLLDLQEDVKITEASVVDGKLVLVVDTEIPFPEVGDMVYETDENSGAIAFVDVLPA